ncbi:MAG: CHAT domain-containing protein [Pseudomonadota bacterium]
MKAFLKSIALLSLWIVAGCQTPGAVSDPAASQPMSFEEARDLVLEMQQIPMAPPPRKMDDIRGLLEAGGGATAVMKDLQRRADLPDAAHLPADARYQFYKSRGNARYEFSRFNEAAEDFHRAIDTGKQIRVADSALYLRLAELEMLAGRYDAAMDLSETAMGLLGGRGFRIGPYYAFQARVHQRMGNFLRSGYAIQRAYSYYRKLPANVRLSLITDSGQMDIGNELDIIGAEAELMEAQGDYARAFTLRAQVLNYTASLREKRPRAAVTAELAMAENLLHQGRLVAAENEARWAVKHAVGLFGRQSPVAAAAAQTLGQVMLAKGNLADASILSGIQANILDALAMPGDEDIMIRARLFRGAVRCAGADFEQAMASFDPALAGMRDNDYLYRRYALRNIDLMLSLAETGRRTDAWRLIQQSRAESGVFGGDRSRQTAEITAVKALLLFREGRAAEAGALFDEAVPELTAILQDPGSTFQQRRRVDYLLRVYVDLLLDRTARGDGDVAETLLFLADIQHGRVETALGQSAARAASLADPTLADLVRQEQDTGLKVASLKATYFNAVAAGGSNLAELERAIQALTRAWEALQARIAEAFPKYDNYVRARPPSLADIKGALAASEALITIWTLPDKTLVWAIPRNGAPSFAVVPLGAADLGDKVRQLRRALKPDARRLGDLPAFDVEIAHALYRDLLEPVAPGWQAADQLLTVVRGPLDQIPLALLVTGPVQPPVDTGLAFDGYRRVPWLIRKAAITRFPSASAMVMLRAMPMPARGREAFAGFGDPLFNPDQVKPAENGAAALARRGAGAIAIRGIRVTEAGGLDSAGGASVKIGQLNRLPDTTEEILEIAESLDADTSTDVFLGKAATETAVKTTDLSRKRILAFATHALLPGDLDGLTQPALALSAPEVTDLDEDGLLTAGEILTLRLDADLVVLSACDTGAGDGSGQEAVSGLGRAFFYSGARALLVTLWPVETTSARKLTTGLFRYKKHHAEATWAKAQQASILELLDTGGMQNAAGTTVASYGHPLFWGPFVVVGDGGVR